MVAALMEQDWATPEERAEARRYRMIISWSPEDDAFLASFPEAPGVVTHGETRVEAALQGEDAILGWLTSQRDAGRPIPPPRDYLIDDIMADWP